MKFWHGLGFCSVEGSRSHSTIYLAHIFVVIWFESLLSTHRKKRKALLDHVCSFISATHLTPLTGCFVVIHSPFWVVQVTRDPFPICYTSNGSLDPAALSLGWIVGLGQLLGDVQICGAVDKEADAMLELA